MKIIRKSTLKRYIDSCVRRAVAKRFKDGPKERIISSIAKDMDELSHAAYELRFLANKKPGELGAHVNIDPRVMKTVENTADQVKKHLMSLNYDKASRMLMALYKKIQSEFPEMNQVGGKTLNILKTALNKVSSLKNL